MSLRLIELVVTEQDVADFEKISEFLDVLGVWTHRLDGGLSSVKVLVQSEKVEPVLKEFDTRYRNLPGYRVTILQAEATIPAPPSEGGQGPNASGSDGEVTKTEDPQRLACAELVQKLSSNARVNRVFVLTVVLSTVVATIGLVRDNMAVIIGAMVIAPLLTPNMALSLATTLGDVKLARSAIWVNGLGIIIALLLSFVIGMNIPIDLTMREISSRTVVSMGDVILGLAAGSAGALAYTTGISAAVVGVMVAVALLPPLVTTGLLLGAGEIGLAWRAFLLLSTNIICVNLAGVATFLWQGVRPGRWWQAERSRKMLRIAWTVWLSLLALLVTLIYLSDPLR